MAKVRTVKLPWIGFEVATTGLYLPFTEWMPSNYAKCRVTFEVVAPYGSLSQLQPMYELADVRNTVTDQDTFGTSKVSAGVQFPSAWTRRDRSRTPRDSRPARLLQSIGCNRF